jgi:hypothetical protein
LGETNRLTLIELSDCHIPRGLSRDFGHVTLHEEGEAELKDSPKQEDNNRQHEGEFERRDTIALMPKGT